MALQVGEKAPPFEAKDQNGNDIKLSDFQGKKVVLYFYPKDDTPGCTAQACSLRDSYDAMLAKGYAVLGVSVDSEKSHKKFAEKYHLPFPLLADTEHHIVEAYGVWAEKSMYGKTYMGTVRTTFIIDENGVIQEIISKIDTKNHAQQVLSNQ
ncbi:thioredoxin-dependent thiol peroxidase [Runella slithyformis]|uniref:thioredoxin-dependent peroxiredoxin n=1 Tax=Runella slithyformis (strain ATCC 29530 / DSM 19594 / LMG 11500 / NCIMB 11436 / LSU 4) TaxID=761193 RepID=A0A7U3ZMQ3_RUNSL|nr:thioredoxin-dependent thiol peroxidase [Runella slithyformis]AEI50012.1 Peroxiredoxin [Runella slithyformis DSM 19594]